MVLKQFRPFGPTPTAPQTSSTHAPSGGASGYPYAAQPTQALAGNSTSGPSGNLGQGTSPAATPTPTAITGTPNAPVEVFFSYSHKDKELRDELKEHLSLLRRQGVISGWHDRQILPGQEWAGEIDKHLGSARVVLLLVSPSFLASDYCYDIEMKRRWRGTRRGRPWSSRSSSDRATGRAGRSPGWRPCRRTGQRSRPGRTRTRRGRMSPSGSGGRWRDCPQTLGRPASQLYRGGGPGASGFRERYSWGFREIGKPGDLPEYRTNKTVELVRRKDDGLETDGEDVAVRINQSKEEVVLLYTLKGHRTR